MQGVAGRRKEGVERGKKNHDDKSKKIKRRKTWDEATEAGLKEATRFFSGRPGRSRRRQAGHKIPLTLATSHWPQGFAAKSHGHPAKSSQSSPCRPGGGEIYELCDWSIASIVIEHFSPSAVTCLDKTFKA